MYLTAKQLFTIFSLLILIFILTSSCQKDDFRTESPIDELADPNINSKPTSQAPYTLAENPTQLEVYGAWHSGNDYCNRGSVRNMTDFDSKNHWIIDRGDGNPSAMWLC